MDIISILFAVAAILSIVILYALNSKYRSTYLVILSLCFILSYSLPLLIYIIGYSIINYLIGQKIHDTKHKISLLRIGIIINLSQLLLLKYAAFAIDPIFEFFNCDIQISKLTGILIPVGISYFTLQGIGYLINIKMGWEKPEKNFPHFLLYMVFYPKFLSGPIERSNHFLPQLKSQFPYNEQNVVEGLKIVLLGFFKKVVIANQLGEIVISAHSDITSFGSSDLWIVTLIQPLYLYFDFSGYTDIAIGIARTYGITLLPNFNNPFLAENMTTFWKKFHISLSSWFNDYVFRQTSFKYRKWGVLASIYAVFITWTLFGIWHGAGWNFMILGILQATAINYEFFTRKIRYDIGSKIPVFWRTFASRVVTYFFYSISLIFFFSPDLGSSVGFCKRLFVTSPQVSTVMHNMFCFALGLALLWLLIDYFKQSNNIIYSKIINRYNNSNIIRFLVYYSMVMLILAFIGNKLVFVYQVF